jgi:hypothetical protein
MLDGMTCVPGIDLAVDDALVNLVTAGYHGALVSPDNVPILNLHADWMCQQIQWLHQEVSSLAAKWIVEHPRAAGLFPMDALPGRHHHNLPSFGGQDPTTCWD